MNQYVKQCWNMSHLNMQQWKNSMLAITYTRILKVWQKFKNENNKEITILF